MELSIIIVSYNVKNVLIKCIESIHAYLKGLQLEIIVVDNNSTDGTVEAIHNIFPNLILIKNDQNKGFAEANNQGIKVSQGDYILLLNPDTYLTDSSLIFALHYIKTQNDVIVAPKLLNLNNSLQISAWEDKSLLVMALELYRVFIDRYPLETFTTPQVVDNVAGAAMLFKRSLIDKIGYLDSALFWMEDFDFCYRLRKAGGKVIYFPGASLIHYGGESKNTNLKVAYSNANISKLKFYKKHHSTLRFFFAELIILGNILSRSALFLCLSPFNKKCRSIFTAYMVTLKKYFRYIFLDEGALT